MEYEEDYKRDAVRKIKTKVITKKQTPETDEALLLLYHAKKRLLIFTFIMTLIIGTILFCDIGLFVTKIFDGAIFCAIFSVLLIALTMGIRKKKLIPYYRLLKVAMRNDDIRHEERIKFRERKRLENEYDNEIFVTKGQMSKIQKTKVQNIKAMEKLEEANKLNPVKETTFQVASKNRIKLNDISVGSNRPMVPTKKPE